MLIWLLSMTVEETHAKRNVCANEPEFVKSFDEHAISTQSSACKESWSNNLSIDSVQLSMGLCDAILTTKQ